MAEVKITIKGKDEASKVFAGVADEAAGLGDAVSGVSGRGGGGGGGLAGMGAMLGGPVTAGAAVAGAAVAGLGVTALNTALDFDQGMRTIQTQLGLTADEAAALGPAVEETFISNMVGSAAEAGAAVAETRRQLAGLANEELGAATTQSLVLAQAMGEDQAKVLNSVNTLMANFGLSSQQAFDFVAEGFQKGLNNSGDFLDSIGEYSTQFANGGADAGQFFSVMESGLGAGMLGTDKAADLFKEFRLRIQDGSKATKSGLADLGISWDELNESLASGSITAADAFGIVQQALIDTEDPTIRMQAGAALMGSQFEDLGDSAVAGIDMATTSLEDMQGATDETGAQFTSLGDEFESVKRELLTALLPVGEAMIELAREYMPEIKAAAAVLSEWLGQKLPIAIDWLGTRFAEFMLGVDTVKWGFEQVWTAIEPLVTKVGEFGSALAGIGDTLPDWLTPGSPTPFELGLVGIDEAMQGLTRRTLPELEAGLALGEPVLPPLEPLGAGLGGGGGMAGLGGGIVINVAGSVTTEQELIEVVRRGIDAYGRRNY